jgi:WD40 repeat protein
MRRLTLSALACLFTSIVAADEPKPAVDSLGDPLPDGTVMRLGTRRFRIAPQPFGTYVSLPDGKAFLIPHRRGGEQQDEIRWMDADTGTVTDVWKLPRGHFLGGVSADGRYAVTTPHVAWRSDQRRQEWTLTLFDVRARKPVWEVRDQRTRGEWDYADRVALSRDGKWLVTSTENWPGTTEAWDVGSGKQLWRLLHGVSPLGFADDGKVVVVQNPQDMGVYIYDRETGRELNRWLTDRLNRPIFLSPDGKYFFANSRSRNRRVAPQGYETLTGKALDAFGEFPDDRVAHYAVSGDRRTLVTGDSSVRVWDWPSGKFRRAFDLGIGPTARLSLSYDGKRLEALSYFGSTICLYDVDTGKRREQPGDGHAGAIIGIAATPDGKLVSVGRDQAIRTWDLKEGKTIALSSLKNFALRSAFALSPDGRLVAVSTPAFLGQEDISLVERDTGKVDRVLATDRDVEQVSFSPDGNFVASVSSGHKIGLNVWSLAKGGVALSSASPPLQANIALAFSPDSQQLAVAESFGVRVFDTATWKEKSRVPANVPRGVEFSPDGRLLAITDESGVHVLERLTMQARAHWPRGSSALRNLVFSPSSRFLAWYASVNSIYAWDGLTGEIRGPLIGHDLAITGLAFAGDRLASASEDTTILIWDILAAAKRKPAQAADNVATAWKDLAGDDAEAAFAAIRTLTAHPVAAMRLAGQILKPVAPADEKRVAELLKALDDSKFAERQKAAAELQRIGEVAIPALEQFLAGKPGVEASRQAQAILTQLREHAVDAERRHQFRALEVLERIGSAAALDVIRQLTEGAASTRLTKEAEAILKRSPSR